jgi:hypothetical protein
MVARTLIILSLVLALEAASSLAQGRDETGAARSRDPFRYKGSSVRIPQELTAPTAEPLAEPVLQGIILDPGGRHRAIIDGREVRQGERFGDLHIRQIIRYGIIVDDGAGTRQINLFHD